MVSREIQLATLEVSYFFLDEVRDLAVVDLRAVDVRDVPLRPRVVVEPVFRPAPAVRDDVLFRVALFLRAGLRFLPPPVSLFTVAHALRPASRPPTPRFS
jgi:hypothetical protein